MPYFISYEQTERMIAALLERADAWQPEAVVGITRGGLIPATMAASMLALPLAILGWDRRGGPKRGVGPPPKTQPNPFGFYFFATRPTPPKTPHTPHPPRLPPPPPTNT